MAASGGKDFVLQIDTNGAGSYSTIGGLRAKTATLNAEPIDISNHGSSQWRELLASAGMRSMTISGSGVFTDSSTEQQLLTDFLAQTLRSFKLLDSVSGDFFTGSFKITSIEYAGEYNGEKTWSITLESSGAVTFTAA